MIQKFVEVPNTTIQEPVTNDFGYDLCYDMAQEYGIAELVWYALNGKRVVEGTYTNEDLLQYLLQPSLSRVTHSKDLDHAAHVRANWL